MSTIEEAIARKKMQLPQFDYMWRIELPELGREGLADPHGVVPINSYPEVAEFITGGTGGGAYGALSRGVERVANVAQGVGNTLKSAAFKVGMAVGKYVPDSVKGLMTERNFSAIGGGITLSDSQTAQLNHRVFSIDTPYRSFDIGKHTFGHRHFYSATTNEIGSLGMRIDEYEDGATLGYILQWQRLISNPDGTNNPPATYKRDIKFIKMASSGLDLHVSIFRGCFPNEIAQSAFTYDSNAISQLNVTFTCDDVTHFIIPASQVISAVESVQDSIINAGGSSEATDLLSSLMKNSVARNLTTAALTEINRRIGSYFF